MFVLRRLLRRRFASKDPEDLRKQFEQMKQQAEKTAASTAAEPEIKVTDQKQREESLKDQFRDLSQDLSKETGEAKSAFQRLKETYESAKLTDFASEKANKLFEKLQPPQEEEKKPEEAAEAKESSEPKAEDSQNSEQQAIRGSKLNPLFKMSKVTSEYVTDAIREAFPTNEYKMKKAAERQQKMQEMRELMEKFERGEITGDDANIPEWKRGALQPVLEKKSIFQRTRERIKSSVFGTKIEISAKKAMESPHLKSIQASLDTVKSGLEDVKEGVQDDLDAADSRLLNRLREKWSETSFETDEGKAVRLLRAYDDEFDVFSLEDMMEGIIEDLLLKFDAKDWSALSEITDGQAKKFFKQKLKRKVTEGKELVTEVVDVSRATYLGTNLEDRSLPKFSFSSTIRMYEGLIDQETPPIDTSDEEKSGKEAEESSTSDDEESSSEEEEKKKKEEAGSTGEAQSKPEISEVKIPDSYFGPKQGRVVRAAYFITVCRNPKYSPEKHAHPWMFTRFMLLEEAGRIQ